MFKLLLINFVLTLILCSCNNQTRVDKGKVFTKVHKSDTTKYDGIKGTWVRHNKIGFELIDIKDTSNVLYYGFVDRKTVIDTITTDRYGFYKSTATLHYEDSSKIIISTDAYRLPYTIKGDTLIELDKMGDQKFIKVYSTGF